MANTKISQLPSYTGTAADLRWFVMNNSGETETYKFSGYTSPFISTGTTNKVVQPLEDKALLQVGSGNTFNDYSGSNLKNALVVGNRNKVDGVADTPVMFIGNDLDSQQFGSYALHIGSGHYASGSYNLSIGDNSFEMNGSFGLIIGSGNGGSQLHKQWGTFGFNLGQSCQIQGIDGAFIYGKNHTISGGQWGGIFGGIGNSISSSGNYNTIIGGESNSITGGTNVSMIGCSGRTADASNTTYVENLRVFRQAQYGNFNNGNRSINYTIDWDNGNIQKVVLTGSCVFSATNITDGTTYIFKVEQDNSGNRAATWSSGIFKFANGAPPTLSTGANDVDIFTFVAMDGLLYGVAQLNFG